MAVVMDGAIAAAAGTITDGAEVVATIMVGGIIAITGDLTSISSERPLSWRPLLCPVVQAMSPFGLPAQPKTDISAGGSSMACRGNGLLQRPWPRPTARVSRQSHSSPVVRVAISPPRKIRLGAGHAHCALSVPLMNFDICPICNLPSLNRSSVGGNQSPSWRIGQ
jgi:hypothetical protein